MGNRAVITTVKAVALSGVKWSDELGVYVHWNGGRDSVEAFLEYCRRKGYPSPESDNYGWARLCQVIGNFFGDTTSLGIDRCCNLDCDNGDNGTYVIKDWKIVQRFYNNYPEQRNYDINDFMRDIDKSMPEKERLGEKLFK